MKASRGLTCALPHNTLLPKTLLTTSHPLDSKGGRYSTCYMSMYMQGREGSPETCGTAVSVERETNLKHSVGPSQVRHHDQSSTHAPIVKLQPPQPAVAETPKP